MKINRMFIISYTILLFIITSTAAFNKFKHKKRNNPNGINNNILKRAKMNNSLECFHDDKCKDSERCISNKCADVCKPDPCGVNAWCRGAENHHPLCTCYLGLTGDPHIQCYRKSCITNEDCVESDECKDNSCTAVCPHNLCGMNRTCIGENHKSVCYCAEGFSGDPKIGCYKNSCKSDNDCVDSDYCDNNRCTAACPIEECGDDEFCHVENHRPVCTCKEGFIGQPESGCVKTCSTSNDCDDTEKCEKNLCVEVCDNPYPCDETAWCHVEDHVHVCTDTEIPYSSPKIEYTKMNCTNTDDCDEFEQCRNNECIDVCHPNPCGDNAWCARDNHRPVCFCINGFTGDPYKKCVMMQCIKNKHCKYYEECRNNMCIDVCEPNPCGQGATCYVKHHHPVCLCKDKSVEPDTGCKVQSVCKSKIRNKINEKMA